MIEDPDRWAPAYAEAGARNVTIHAEADCTDPVARSLRGDHGVRAAGPAVNPATPVEPYADLLPGSHGARDDGGAGLRRAAVPRPGPAEDARARALAGGRDAAVWLQVDGGVTEETIERCAEAGADVFVAGSAVYGSDDPGRAVRALRAQAERATAHAAWVRPGP